MTVELKTEAFSTLDRRSFLSMAGAGALCSILRAGEAMAQDGGNTLRFTVLDGYAGNTLDAGVVATWSDNILQSLLFDPLYRIGDNGLPEPVMIESASDLRSKNKGEAFTKGLDVIEQINPTHFTKKEGFGATDVNHVGIIAQELESILPEAIKIGKCQDIEDFRFYDKDVLVYTLLNAVKELSEKVKQLEAK